MRRAPGCRRPPPLGREAQVRGRRAQDRGPRTQHRPRRACVGPASWREVGAPARRASARQACVRRASTRWDWASASPEPDPARQAWAQRARGQVRRAPHPPPRPPAQVCAPVRRRLQVRQAPRPRRSVSRTSHPPQASRGTAGPPDVPAHRASSARRASRPRSSAPWSSSSSAVPNPSSRRSSSPPKRDPVADRAARVGPAGATVAGAHREVCPGHGLAGRPPRSVPFGTLGDDPATREAGPRPFDAPPYHSPDRSVAKLRPALGGRRPRRCIMCPCDDDSSSSAAWQPSAARC